MKKILTFLVLTAVLLCVMFVAVSATGSEITFAAVTDIIAPVHGQSPVMSAASAEPAKYTVKSIQWDESDDEGYTPEKTLQAGEKFLRGKAYWAFVTLEAMGDYVFADSISAEINGKTANSHYKPTNNGKNIVIYCYFTFCKQNIGRVDIAVVNPVVGKTPTFAKVNTDEYFSENTTGVSGQTNGVSWTNQASGINLNISNAFKENTKYTVKYYLTAKEHCQFNGTEFYINGKKATILESNTDKTKVIVGLSDIIPDDGKTKVKDISVTVTAPVDGAKPDFTKIDGIGYYSDNNGNPVAIYKNGIAWYKTAYSYIGYGTTETFKGGTDYTLKIVLVAKDGYKFTSDVAVKINGINATVENFEDGSINVSVTLTAPKKEHVHSPSDWKSDGEHHWKVCTDASCGEVVSEKQAHSAPSADGKCTVCGYKLPVATTVAATEAPATPEATTAPSATNAPEAVATEVITPGDTGEATETAETSGEAGGDTQSTAETKTPETEKPIVDAPSDEGGVNPSIFWIALGVFGGVMIGVIITYIVLKKKTNK